MRIGRESQCLPYAGFLFKHNLHIKAFCNKDASALALQFVKRRLKIILH